MSKHMYRVRRRHGAHAAGAELHLTEAEAAALDNEAPGVLERIIPIEVEHTQDRAHGAGRQGSRPPIVKDDV